MDASVYHDIRAVANPGSARASRLAATLLLAACASPAAKAAATAQAEGVQEAAMLKAQADQAASNKEVVHTLLPSLGQSPGCQGVRLLSNERWTGAAHTHVT